MLHLDVDSGLMLIQW